MTEKQLISQLKGLKEIKPKKDWVVFTKKNIFKNDRITLAAIIKELQIGEKFVFQHKLAFAPVLIVAVLIGLFGFALNSVPGESLFVLRKITEQSQAVFIADNYKSIHNFEIAGRRLDDLEKIAQSNDVKKLAPALTEYNETVSRAAKTLNRAENVEQIALEIKKLHDKEKSIRSLGIEVGDNEDFNNILPELVERLIKDLEKQENISQEQKDDIMEDYDGEDYWSALEKLWELSQ